MAKILFIQQEASEKFGTMILAAVLKEAGHQVDLFIELLEKRPVEEHLGEFKPDFLGFSITTIEREWALALSARLKRSFPLFSVFGGADPTYNPQIIKEKAVDYLCRGEGERAFPALLDRLSAGKTIKGIANLWGKENGRIIKNPLGDFIRDLDSLPPPDREIYYKYPLLRNLSTKKFLASRGCPYQCTYCSNHAYLKLFAGKGQFVRFRSPAKVIEEIQEIKGRYGLRQVYLADETLTLNKDWLFDLLALYKKKIKEPFSCLARANELDEETIKALKKSGCFYVAFGVETGSERIRNGILKRNITNRELLKVARLMHQYHLPFLTHHMYVSPTETLNETFQTVELNARMGSDSVWDTIFQPFENTEIYRFCQRKGLLPKKFKVDSMFGESVIKNPEKKAIQNVRRLAWWGIKFPFLIPLIKKAVFLPNNFIFELALKISEVKSIRGRWRLGYWEMIRLAWRTGRKLG